MVFHPFAYFLPSLSVCLFSFSLALGPCAIKQAKEAIDRGLATPSLEEGLQIEKECYSRLLDTRDRLEGLEAFSQKRSPKYMGS
jgi:enoyl-CoA hydratase/carnithine racemase